MPNAESREERILADTRKFRRPTKLAAAANASADALRRLASALERRHQIEQSVPAPSPSYETMPHRTTFNPTRGVNPSPRPQPIASMRLLESRVQLENVDINWFSCF